MTEHSRIYHFRNGAEDPLRGEFYIGSADRLAPRWPGTLLSFCGSP